MSSCVVFALALAITLLGWQFTRRTTDQHVRQEFGARVREISGDIQACMTGFEDVLQASRAFVLASGHLSRRGWLIFQDAQHFELSHPGMLGIGLAEEVRPADLHEFIRSMRAEGSSGYRVVPAGDRPAYAPIRLRALSGFASVVGRADAIFLAGGCIISLLLFAVVWTLTSTRLRAEALARKMTRDMRESEARFRALTEMSWDFYWEQDENFRITAMSAGVEKSVGIDSQWHIGKTRWEVGKSLELMVVAEGVETREQLDFLRAHGCDEYQGYYFNKPMPAEQFAQLLQLEKDAPAACAVVASSSGV